MLILVVRKFNFKNEQTNKPNPKNANNNKPRHSADAVPWESLGCSVDMNWSC